LHIDSADFQVSLVPLEATSSLSLDAYDQIVIGASIRYGKHRREVLEFIQAHLAYLESRPSAFFFVCLVARKPNRNSTENNPYVQKLLKIIDWKPKHIAVFAGRLDYPSYKFVDRIMIRFIMRLTGSPADHANAVEFTNWEAVDAFGREISLM